MTKYLIVGPSWVGDMVMAQSLFMILKQQDPEAVIDVVGPAWSAPVLKRMPEVRRAIVLDSKHGQWGFTLRYRLGKSLRYEKYDQAIVLPRSWKSALVPYFAKIKHRIGFHGEQRFFLLTERRRLNKTILNQTVKRFVSLGVPVEKAYPPEVVPFPTLSKNVENLNSIKKRLDLSVQKPVVAFMPGAEYGPAKQWPLDHYKKLAKYFINHNYQVWVLGGPKDKTDGDVISEDLNNSIRNLCGKTKLEDVIDLLSDCELSVSNDSGLMHIAAAVGIKVHGIYGSTSEYFTPALSDQFTVHNLHLNCSPCFKRVCPLGHTNCLKQLLPDRMIKELINL